MEREAFQKHGNEARPCYFFIAQKIIKAMGNVPELHEYIHSSLSSVILDAERGRCRKTLKYEAEIIGTPLQSMPY